jgi:hypothetical protein
MKRFYPIFGLMLTLAVGVTAQQSPAGAGSSAGRAIPDQSEVVTPQITQPPTTSPDPLLDVPPLPQGKVSLIGGTVKNVDRVREKLVVQVFGGRAMKISFDERTHIYRDGIETTQLGIRRGDPVYVDTMLDGPRVFARNIRVGTVLHGADASGQVLSVNARQGTITLKDQILAQPVTFQVDQKTLITRDQQPLSVAAVQPGALVAVKFYPERARRGVAREISVIAAPGMQFTFAGKVTHLDLRSGTLSIENLTDGKTYDLNFGPHQVDKRDLLGVGSQVTVLATYQSWGYRAENVIVNAAPEGAYQRR